METLVQMLSKHEDYMDYHSIHTDNTLQDLLYKKMTITHPHSPFDYIDSVCLLPNDELMMTIFVEPVGTISFTGPCATFFEKLTALFNSQPADMTYAEAGNLMYQYVSVIRKGYGIHLSYVNPSELWANTALLEETSPTTLIDSITTIQTVADLATYIEQQNRVPIAIIDDLSFMEDGLSSLMMGEIVATEAYMPDLCKLIIDLTKFNEHNATILSIQKDAFFSKKRYPKHRIVSLYLPYNTVIKESNTIQLLQEHEIPGIKEEAATFWSSGFEGDYVEYKEKMITK